MACVWSYFAPGHSRSSAHYPRIPDILFYPAHGNGTTRRLAPANEWPNEKSYGQHGLTFVDRLGAWLSQRAIRRHLPKRYNLEVLELGCGYHATELIGLGPFLKRGVGVDFQLAPELKGLAGYNFHEGSIEDALPG